MRLPSRFRPRSPDYYQKFSKYSESWISPELQQKQLRHEADLASGKAGVAAVQPVVATYLAMAVQFDVIDRNAHAGGR